MDKYYFYISDSGMICSKLNENSDIDRARYSIGNCFYSKEEAQIFLDKITVYMELKRYADAVNDEKIDWNDPDQRKYFTAYNHYFDKFGMGINTCLEIMGQVHFNDDKKREKAIDDIGKEKIKKLFKD